MNYKEIYYPESRFGGFTDIDGTIVFYTRANSLISSSSVVLDFGCGRGAYGDSSVEPVKKQLRIFKGRVKKVIGLDVDESGQANPFLDEFHVLEGGYWPLETNAVDVCICDNVLEHIPEPESFFSESQRVIKHGGYLCIRTPNAWGYPALVSKLIPNKHHAQVLDKVHSGGIKEEDVFPTFYRCNSVPKLRRMLDKYGFDSCVYGYEAEPSYLSFSRFAYRLGVLHQKLAPRALRPAIFAFGKLEKL